MLRVVGLEAIVINLKELRLWQTNWTAYLLRYQPIFVATDESPVDLPDPISNFQAVRGQSPVGKSFYLKGTTSKAAVTF